MGNLIEKMTDPDPNIRPTIQQILLMPMISKIVIQMLYENYLGNEITAKLRI